ncbi:MAG TPA: CNNM domain-containing protein, partial [Elusimicrobiales bacterium]|nr:CNNM domain-containing protein [Elusimicrobiales bacterium]
MSELLLEAAVIGTMLGVNALFAAYEIALASVPRARLASLEKRNAPGSASALFLKDRMEGSLALVQLAITLAGAVAAATGGTAVGEYLVPWLEFNLGIGNAPAEFAAIAIFVVPFSVFSIIFSELVPKMFAIENNERLTLLLSPLMRALYGLFHTLIAFFERSVRLFTGLARRLLPGPSGPPAQDDLAELFAALAAARSRKAFGLFEEQLAGSALELSRKTVREAMVPAADVSRIPAALNLPDALVRAHADMHTRFPVVETDDSLDSAIGYLNFKDIVTVLRLNPS